MRLSTAIVAAGILVLLVPLASPARAQMDSREGIQLQNQILELRRDVQALRDQTARGGGSTLGGSRVQSSATVSGGSDIAAALVDRVARLEDEIRELRGRLEQSENARQRMADDLSKQISDLSFRLDNGAGAAPPPRAPAPAAPPPVPLGTAPAAPTAPGKRTPELAIQEGNAALARRDYAAAEAAAREVIGGPKTPRVVDAQFLLAEALQGKKDYQGAAIAFDDTYNRVRTGAHAQDSLIGLANSLSSIGEKRAACATMDKLKAEFPSPRPDLKDAIAAARQKGGCR